MDDLVNAEHHRSVQGFMNTEDIELRLLHGIHGEIRR